MSEKSCNNCMVFKKGDCLGQGLCDFYNPAPSADAKEYWPKTMRSRYSYAGSNASDYDWAKKKNSKSAANIQQNPTVSWKKTDLVKRINFQKKTYDNPGSADILLRFLYEDVIAWISFDTVKIASGYKFKPSCLLQLNKNTLVVDSPITEKKEDRAMLRGICLVANHIVKPCSIYIITDRDLFNGIDSNKPAKDDDLLYKALTVFNEKKCTITELIIKDGSKLIYNQVINPTTDVSEVIDSTQPKAIEDITIKPPKPSVTRNNSKKAEKNRGITQEEAQKLQNAMNSGKDKESKPLVTKETKIPKHNNNVSAPEGLQIQCRVCNRIFIMSPSEIDFYKKKGFQMPQRCKDCRDKKIMYSDADYYDRGLKHNSYQRSLDIYGPRINVSGGLENSPGYRLAEDKNGKSTYVRKFGGKTEIIKKRHL